MSTEPVCRVLWPKFGVQSGHGGNQCEEGGWSQVWQDISNLEHHTRGVIRGVRRSTAALLSFCSQAAEERSLCQMPLCFCTAHWAAWQKVTSPSHKWLLHSLNVRYRPPIHTFFFFFFYEHCFNYLWQRKPDQQPKMSQDICWLEHQDGKSSYRVLKSTIAWKCSYFSLLPDTSLKVMKSRADPHSPRLLVAQLDCFIESAPIRYTRLCTNYIISWQRPSPHVLQKHL